MLSNKHCRVMSHIYSFTMIRPLLFVQNHKTVERLRDPKNERKNVLTQPNVQSKFQFEPINKDRHIMHRKKNCEFPSFDVERKKASNNHIISHVCATKKVHTIATTKKCLFKGVYYSPFHTRLVHSRNHWTFSALSTLI